jgi:hypothetical protein
MFLVGLDQVRLDDIMKWDLLVGILFYGPKDFPCAATTEQIANQHSRLSIDKSVERQPILSLDFHGVNFSATPGAGIVIVEPMSLDRIPELRFCLPEHLRQKIFCVFVVHADNSLLLALPARPSSFD